MDNTELYLRLYEEERNHARFHEEHINSTTNLIALAVAGIFTFAFGVVEMNLTDVVAAVAVIFLGIYGLFITHKKAERRKLHFERGYKFLAQINLPEGAVNLQEIAEMADCKLMKQRPILYHTNIRLMWSCFHFSVILLGLVLLGVSLTQIGFFGASSGF